MFFTDAFIVHFLTALSSALYHDHELRDIYFWETTYSYPPCYSGSSVTAMHECARTIMGNVSVFIYICEFTVPCFMQSKFKELAHPALRQYCVAAYASKRLTLIHVATRDAPVMLLMQ